MFEAFIYHIKKILEQNKNYRESKIPLHPQTSAAIHQHQHRLVAHHSGHGVVNDRNSQSPQQPASAGNLASIISPKKGQRYNHSIGAAEIANESRGDSQQLNRSSQKGKSSIQLMEL